MNIKVKNIKPGHCELWYNEKRGNRYEKLAIINKLDNDTWHWWPTCYTYLPEEPPVRSHRTRSEAILDCKRTALAKHFETALIRQPRPSQHYHSPRWDALMDIAKSGCFSFDEQMEFKKRAETFAYKFAAM